MKRREIMDNTTTDDTDVTDIFPLESVRKRFEFRFRLFFRKIIKTRFKLLS